MKELKIQEKRKPPQLNLSKFPQFHLCSPNARGQFEAFLLCCAKIKSNLSIFPIHAGLIIKPLKSLGTIDGEYNVGIKRDVD